MLRRVLVMGWAAALVCLPAHAQYRYGNGDGTWVQQSEQRAQQGRQDARDKGRDQRGNENARRGSLSPDERRELDRDLQRANREIYRKDRERR